MPEKNFFKDYAPSERQKVYEAISGICCGRNNGRCPLLYNYMPMSLPSLASFLYPKAGIFETFSLVNNGYDPLCLGTFHN